MKCRKNEKMFSDYEKLNQEVARKAQEEKEKHNAPASAAARAQQQSSSSTPKPTPESREAAFQRFIKLSQKERDIDEFEARVKQEIAAQQGGGAHSGLSRSDAMRFNQSKDMN